MKKMLNVAFIVAALAGMSNASAQATGPKRGWVCKGLFSLEILRCENIGDVTIKQIYEKGFKVVQMHSLGQSLLLIIEEQ